jgi:hypothetical protein
MNCRACGAQAFFHHKPAVMAIADTQFPMRDNRDLIGGVRSLPASQDGLRSCPKATFSALCNVTPLFSKTLSISPLNSKTESIFSR